MPRKSSVILSDNVVRVSAERRLEHSRRVLLDTADMVDPFMKGRPLKRPDEDAAAAAHKPDGRASAKSPLKPKSKI